VYDYIKIRYGGTGMKAKTKKGYCIMHDGLTMRKDRGWGIYFDGVLIDGGFFSKDSAEDYYYKEYRNEPYFTGCLK